MSKEEFKNRMNEWGSKKIPFLFIVDFEFSKPVLVKLNDINPIELKYAINGFTNSITSSQKNPQVLSKSFISFSEYKKKFDSVYSHLQYGDTFLTNLTVKSNIELNCSLEDVYNASRAKYKLWVKDKFLVFSPESFIKMELGKIFSYPMKGTIDARLPQAEEIILNNQKEKSEHVTIVDLIRNDLSQVSSNVCVTRFRYTEEIKTNHKNLLQVSSEIAGDLPPNYESHIGDILVSLLPAGSVSGAPKPKTIEVIKEAEQEPRGYYTGVFGYFDGLKLDSGVMIRFIEQNNGQFFYRSGGGITSQSEAEAEYQEVINKVYVPVG
jgi:para-aminobenzoate synthetase component I